MKKEIKIGLTVMAGVLFLYLGVAWIKSIHFFAANRNTYKILFQDVSGLKEGDPVTVFGLPSGNVESIALQNEGAVVTINLSESISVKSDAAAEIRVKELMGGKLVAFTPGLAKANLPDNSLILGTTSLDFSSAFAKAGEFLDKFEGEDVEALIDNFTRIAEAFANVAEEVDSMDTGQLLSDINQSASRLNGILAEVERRRLVSDIDRSLENINELANNADSTLNAFGKLADKVSDQTLPAVDRSLAQINELLTEADKMVATLNDLTTQMKNQKTLAGKILYDETLGNDFEYTLDNLNRTLDHIRTKKIHVRMSLTKKQKVFSEEVEE